MTTLSYWATTEAEQAGDLAHQATISLSRDQALQMEQAAAHQYEGRLFDLYREYLLECHMHQEKAAQHDDGDRAVRHHLLAQENLAVARSLGPFLPERSFQGQCTEGEVLEEPTAAALPTLVNDTSAPLAASAEDRRGRFARIVTATVFVALALLFFTLAELASLSRYQGRLALLGLIAMSLTVAWLIPIG